MTINHGAFTDYASLPRAATLAKYNHCAPLEVLIGEYLDATYGTVENGCYGVRDNHAGTGISVHSFGRAGDRSFRAVAHGNQAEKRRIMLFAIEDLKLKSKEWSIQAIHDYMGCRIWRSNRDPKQFPDGWKIQKPDSYGMGQSWADWIHVEVHDIDGASFDTTPLMSRFGYVDPPQQVRPVIGLGSKGPLVKVVQEFLSLPSPGPNQAAYVGNADGNWGPRTQMGWNNLVLWNAVAHPGAMSTDGNVDGVDWNIVAWGLGGWDKLYAAGFPRGV